MIKDYESGDLIPADYLKKSVISDPEYPGLEETQESAMIIRKVPFKEICDRADEELLEYDIKDMWSVWQKTGCYEVLRDGNLVWWWPRDEQTKES